MYRGDSIGIQIEIEERHLKLLNTVRTEWAKLGLGLDAGEAMIDLLTRIGIAAQEQQKEQMIEQAKRIVKADKASKKAAKDKTTCKCKGGCK